MKRGRMVKYGLAVAFAAAILMVPAVLYGASFKTNQARTAMFIDSGLGVNGAVDWQSVMAIMNPNPFDVRVTVEWWGGVGAAPWACGFKFLGHNDPTPFATCGPVTIFANQSVRFSTDAVFATLPGAPFAFLVMGHIKMATFDRNNKVVVDGWIFNPGKLTGAGGIATSTVDGTPLMRGGFHQEWVLDDDLWAQP